MPAKDDSWLIPQTLVNDAETALSFVEVAANRHDAELLERMSLNARATYHYIVWRRLSVPMSADYATLPESKLSTLKESLERLSQHA